MRSTKIKKTFAVLVYAVKKVSASLLDLRLNNNKIEDLGIMDMFTSYSHINKPK